MTEKNKKYHTDILMAIDLIKEKIPTQPLHKMRPKISI